MANLNLTAGDNITLTKSGENLEISSNQSEIIVSSQEPNTGEEVWFKTKNNLFDKSTVTRGYFINASGNPQTDNTASYSDFISLQVGEYYSANKNFTYAYYNSNKQFVEANLTSRKSIVASYPYVRVNIYTSDIDVFKFEQNLENKKIYTKNDNGVYEEFYDETSVKGDLLFVGKTNTNLTLLDNINNYKELEITHTNNNENMWNIAKIPVMQTTKTVLQRMNVSNTTEKQITQFFFKTITLSGTSLTVDQNRAVFMESPLTDYQTISGTSSNDNTIYITKIVGYK